MAILAGFTVTLLYGGFLALRGAIGVGSYSVLVYLTQRLLWPMTRLADMTDLYQRSMASIQRVMDLVQTPVAIADGGVALPLERRARRADASTTCASPYDDAPDALRRRSRSTSRPARPWRSSAAPAAARARWSSCCCASTSRARARSGSTASRSSELAPARPAARDRLRRAGSVPGRRHRRREHRVRRARRDARGGGRRRGRRRGRRVHPRAAARLRHAGRRARAEAVGRPAPAGRAGARAAARTRRS